MNSTPPPPPPPATVTTWTRDGARSMERMTTMGRQIVKQPNGLYAIWSSVVDDFVMLDATPEEIIQDSIERASKEIRADIENTVKHLDWGEAKHVYYQFAMSFKECIRTIKLVHGKNTETLQMLGLASVALDAAPDADGGNAGTA